MATAVQGAAARWAATLLAAALVAGCTSAPVAPRPSPLLAGAVTPPAGLAAVPGAGAAPTAAALPLPAAPEVASGWTARPGVWAARHLAVTAHPLATDAALRTLRAGGSAVDAAIAAQLVLTLVEPQSSGIGGGLFMVLVDGGRVRALDGRETAPAAATPDLFLREGRPLPFAEAVEGGLAVGTPGVLRALELAHREHGRRPWAELFEPAIALAEQGFEIGPRLARLLREPSAAGLKRDPEAAALFFEPDGTPRAAGTRVRNPALATVLREVAQGGAGAFYRGAVAADIVRRVQSHPQRPGRLTEADLAGYRAVWREPLCFDADAGGPPARRALRLCGMPAPSSGTVAIGQMLGLLEAHRQRGGPALASLPPRQAPFGLEPDPLAVHLFSEAGRLAFADRGRYLADPDFVRLPAPGLAALLDPAYLSARAAQIGERSLGTATPGDPFGGARLTWADDRSADRTGTSHLSIVDSRGQAVAMTTTIESAFGARLMVRGFLLNNQLTDFSFVPEEQGRPVANRVEPGKRPRSSMSPMLMFERHSERTPERMNQRAAEAGMRLPGAPLETQGALVAVVGSPGGSSIIPYVAKSIVALFDWHLDAQQAAELPNFGSRNGPTELEAGRHTQALADALRARGHEVRAIDLTSGLHLIERRRQGVSGGWFGGADPRREGRASGD
jgi:gamma-glutamyltranspeptidase / glutathione hydrolase